MIASVLFVLGACKKNPSTTEGKQGERVSLMGTTNQQKASSNPVSNADGRQIVQYELPALSPQKPEQLLRKKGFTVSYNRETKCPNWVAWHLTKAHTYGNHQRSREFFTEDEAVSRPRATDNDYYNSHYDRGHMCPAADNKWDDQAIRQSFLFTNICPQNHGLNKYEWNDVEMLCRDWARNFGAIDVVCGPVFDKAVGQRKTIGRNKVHVPDRFFKAVLCRQGKQTKAIGFLFNNEGKKQPLHEHICTVDELERLTGFDFFPQLPDDIEKRVEAVASLHDWK